MTDITELAQSLKAAAIDAKELAIIARYSKGRAAAEKFYALANPNNVIALIEALEKAQRMESYWKTQCSGITDHCEELQARIAELEESNAQVIQSRDHYKRMTEEGLKQLAEARTVKLPDLRQIVSGDRYVWSDGVYNYSQDVKVALAAAGIKVEAE